MAERPYVLLSVAMSVDGCIDDATDTRLILSNDADLDRVDEVRAGSDAILVGAGTIRRDNPALLVRAVRYAIERKRSEVELAHQALHDPLTALPNRALFSDRLSVALDRSRRTGAPPAAS